MHHVTKRLISIIIFIKLNINAFKTDFIISVKLNINSFNIDFVFSVVVVVVIYCFTSLLGTNGHLSDIVIRQTRWDEWCMEDNVRVRVIGRGKYWERFPSLAQ